MVPLLLHTVLLYRSVFADDQMYLGAGDAVSVIIWLTVAIYWVGGIFYRLEGLQVFITAAAAVLVWAPLAFPSVHPLAHTSLPAFRLHILISLLAYSLFTIASLQALLMAILEKRLHGGRLPRFLQSLPPLLSMEQLLFRILGLGTLLLTLTLGSGMLFSEELFGQPLKFTHKVVFGILAWCIFAALLTGRRVYGWRGRLALNWTLLGFLALVLAYIGSKFVLEVVLNR
ncbi:MAG: cytochrome c biogenesis protein CcsA [Betaproteobacteria bacterium]